MWQAVLSDPQEREAFHSLLSDYFDSRPQLPTFTPPSRSQPAPTPIALPPRTLPPPALAPRASSSYSNSPAPSSPHEAPGRSLPAGLVQTQAVAGGFNATNRKAFAKDLFASKGPMNRAEMEKKKEVGPLYVKGAIASKPHAPPPRRAAAPSAAPGEEKVRALYDYDGAEAEDLPAREGEELVVVEKVDESWLRCRNSSGATGLIPTSYVQAI